MSTDDASAAYGGQVAAIIASQSRDSTYEPANKQDLIITHRRKPTSLDGMTPIEKRQLELMFAGQDLATFLAENFVAEEDYPLDLEIADVVDDTGALRYRLFGMNYGAIFLMAADTLECLAFAAQHDLEHWHADQRPLFWAMDRALRRGDHGFEQPMKFCWWDDKCWAEIADKPRGTVQSEPYIRKQFAGDA